jgi:hypothetical protein
MADQRGSTVIRYGGNANRYRYLADYLDDLSSSTGCDYSFEETEMKLFEEERKCTKYRSLQKFARGCPVLVRPLSLSTSPVARKPHLNGLKTAVARPISPFLPSKLFGTRIFSQIATAKSIFEGHESESPSDRRCFSAKPQEFRAEEFVSSARHAD